MRILFCTDSFDDRSVEQHFGKEHQAALSSGFAIGLIDFNAIRRRDEIDAFQLLPASVEMEPAIYRGWMLTPEEYEFLYSSLLQRSIALITTPKQYVHCHWLPNSYSKIRDVTPRTVWVPKPYCFDEAAIITAIQQFDGKSLIVKDYVKSQKHYWNDACFIPDSSNHDRVLRVTQRFLELQDDHLQGGLVFREFVELQSAGNHPKSGMPLALEYRSFVFSSHIISVSPYWDAEYSSEVPSMETFLPVLSQVQNPFFSCDVARRKTGEWIIVELGDGQVAGLPERCDVVEFYGNLSRRFQDQSSEQ